MKMKMTLKERLGSRLVPSKDGCLEFVGARIPAGYGVIWDGGKLRGTHRVAWELQNGEIPDGLCVLHRCDNTSCCNVDHLFLGTRADNSADMVRKGRQGRGGACRKVDSDMSHLMFILAVEGRSQKAIGERLGVDQTTVGRYLRGERVA